MPPRIYLDNAATSWPKPVSVYEAVERYQRENGAPAGRGTYAHATAAGQIVERARTQVATLLSAPLNSHVVFASNGTDALNLCLHGLVGPGDHVVTSELEHNSVLRPLSYLKQKHDIAVDYAVADHHGVVTVDSVRRLLTSATRLVALAHASNVTGAVQHVARIAEVCHESGVLLLVDAAQSLGHIPVDVSELGIDLLASSGHKGLLGPLGTGIVYLAPTIHERLEPIRQGGTGSRSDDDRQPDAPPDKFESGNPNVLGLAGLEAGVAFIAAQQEELRRHEQELTTSLIEGLRQLDRVTICGPDHEACRTGLVSFVSDDYDVHELAALLDATAAIQLRAGLHCAPRIHERLQTKQRGGTLRASIGPFNTPADIEALLALLRDLHRK